MGQNWELPDWVSRRLAGSTLVLTDEECGQWLPVEAIDRVTGNLSLRIRYYDGQWEVRLDRLAAMELAQLVLNQFTLVNLSRLLFALGPIPQDWQILNKRVGGWMFGYRIPVLAHHLPTDSFLLPRTEQGNLWRLKAEVAYKLQLDLAGVEKFTQSYGPEVLQRLLNVPAGGRLEHRTPGQTFVYRGSPHGMNFVGNFVVPETYCIPIHDKLVWLDIEGFRRSPEIYAQVPWAQNLEKNEINYASLTVLLRHLGASNDFILHVLNEALPQNLPESTRLSVLAQAEARLESESLSAHN